MYLPPPSGHPRGSAPFGKPASFPHSVERSIAGKGGVRRRRPFWPFPAPVGRRGGGRRKERAGLRRARRGPPAASSPRRARQLCLRVLGLSQRTSTRGLGEGASLTRSEPGPASAARSSQETGRADTGGGGRETKTGASAARRSPVRDKPRSAHAPFWFAFAARRRTASLPPLASFSALRMRAGLCRFP